MCLLVSVLTAIDTPLSLQMVVLTSVQPPLIAVLGQGRAARTVGGAEWIISHLAAGLKKAWMPAYLDGRPCAAAPHENVGQLALCLAQNFQQ